MAADVAADVTTGWGRALVAALVVLWGTPPALAQGVGAATAVGSDSFVVVQGGTHRLAGPGDAFVAGDRVVLGGAAEASVHVAGLDVDIEAPVGGDLYALGAALTVFRPVAGDLTAAAFSLRLADQAQVGGNARIIAGSIMLEGEIDGALTARAGQITLNAAVAGDAALAADTLRFGPAARVGGVLTYSAPAEIAIPSEVAPPERVRFQPAPPLVGTLGELSELAEMGHGRPGPVLARQVAAGALMAAVGAALTGYAFLLAAGAVLLALAPQRIETARQAGSRQAGRALLGGTLVLAAAIGLVPVLMASLLGIPLVPVAMLGVAVLWTLGYLLGVHIVVGRVAAGFGMRSARPGAQVALLAVGLLAGGLLNFVPVLGWMLNFGLVLLGAGAGAMAAVGPALWPAPPPRPEDPAAEA